LEFFLKKPEWIKPGRPTLRPAEPPPRACVSMRRVYRLLDSLSAPGSGGGR